MIDIFSPIPVRAQEITANLIRAQIQIHENDLFTGIFHVHGKSQLVFLFTHGRLISIYQLGERNWWQPPKLQWDDVIDEGSGELRVASVSDDGLRVLRLFLESDFSESKTVPSLPASEIPSYVGHSKGKNDIGLVSVRQNGSSALLLFPAEAESPAEAVLVDDLETQTGSAAVNQIRAWGSRACQVLFCASEPRSEAWREYFLRVSFSQFIQLILSRYSQLAGNFLVTDLDEHVNEQAKNLDIALSLYGTKLSNRQFFENAEHAGKVYASIFGAMNGQMNGIVGERVALSIRKEAVLQLELDDRVLVQEYVISRLKE